MASPYRVASPVSAPVHLGAIVSVHRARHPVTWAGAVVLAVLGVPSMTWWAGPLGLLAVIGMLVVWIGANLLAVPRSIVLREDGVEVTRWLRPARRLAFDDCRSVFHDFGVRTSVVGTRVTEYTLSLEDDEGRVRVPHTMSDASSLLSAIEKRCVLPVSQDAVLAFDDGESLTFGPISLCREGPTIGGQPFAWKHLKKVEASPRRLFFHLEHRLTYTSFAFDRIPYPFVLMRLLERAGVPVLGIEGFVTRA